MKKLLMFLMVAIPILVILIVKLTASVEVGDVFISVQNVSILHDKIRAKVGESLDLECQIYPEIATNKVVTWSSDNEAAATVDMNGHVEFKDIGSGYISVTSQDGNLRAQCYFHVYDTVAHGVELTSPQSYVNIGKELQLTATVFPAEAENQAVEFSSSDESIATVDSNGVVIGVSEGYVEITVKTEYGGYEDYVGITVSNPVTALIVKDTEVITSSKQVQVEYTIEPHDATTKYVNFEVDNREVATVNHVGLITFLKPGQVNLTITTVDGGFERTIKYIYTAGYAYDLTVAQQFISMQVNDVPVLIEYQTRPEFLDQTKAQLEFSCDDEDIAFVDKSGCLHAIKGGSTIVRVKVHTSETEIIERQIYVNVISPAQEIELQDVVTAERTVQLLPKSLPDGSTNEEYFYHIDEKDKATVSPDGLVEFITQEPCTVLVVVYANRDYSDVSKTVYVTYTAGMASEFDLIDSKKTLDYGEKAYLQYSLSPANATARPKISIVSTNPIAGSGKVVEIDDDGAIVAVGGGNARIMAQITLYNGEVVTKYCDITVQRKPESIEILIDEEYFNYQFVTGQNVVKFSGIVSPLDATEKDIIWSVSDKSIAIIDGNSLIFNRAGYVTLTATIGDISNSVEVFYTASNPVFGQVKATFNDEKTQIPERIALGDSFDVEIEKIIPSNIKNPKLYLQVTNQKTANATGVVLRTDGNRVIGVAGGTATLVVNISNSVRISFDIFVERKPESVTVLQENTQVTSQTVKLISSVLPSDATNQNVRYVVKNTDVATVDGDVLTFKKNGVAEITAICEADGNIIRNFVITKVEKDIIYFTSSQKHISVNKGDVLAFESDESYTLSILQNSPIIEGQQVATIEDDKYIRTLAAGMAEIQVSANGKDFTIQIEVAQLVEQIVLTSNLDMFDDEYVVASKSVDLDFDILPSYATNKGIELSFVQATSIAYISGNTVYFTSAGSVTLQVRSKDGNCSYILQLRNTGGDALDGQLNVESALIMNIGQQITIDVTKWVPYDCKNTRIVVSEINSSGKKVIEINPQTNTITAVDSGQTKLVVQLSNGIVKEVDIVCLNKVTDIETKENVLTASDTYSIEATVLPKNATIQDLVFTLEKTDIAILENGTLHFSKPGTAYVIISSTDGSGVQKRVSITSTLGYLDSIVLESSEFTVTKGQSIKLKFDKFPSDAPLGEIKYRIISQQAIDGSNNDVVELLDDGQINAIYGGSAIVRVYSIDYYGTEIFAECKIDVLSPVSNIEIEFEPELQNYLNQNTFITSKDQITFNVAIFPRDATTKGVSYEISSSSIAKIQDNKIIFLQKGRVSIKFISKDSTLGEKSKTYNFYYVGQDIIEATLNMVGIQNNIIRLKAGEKFEFKLDNVYPSDNKNIEFSLRDTVEQRNDLNKPVVDFEDGVIYALNGGQYVFTLFANNLKLQTLTLIVTRDATDIYVEGDLQVYVSQPYYVIKARALESDTHQTLLGYRIDGQGIATVNQEGVVQFSKMGQVRVTIYVVDNPAITKTVEIVYTKQLQSIKFNNAREQLYVGEYVDLFVSALPDDAEEFEYDMSIDNPQLATLTKRGDSYRLIGSAQGAVTVTAKVKDKDISITKTFNFYDRIEDVALELDNSGDLNGQGQYRVFGYYFINEKGEVVQTYQMNVSLWPEHSSKDLLEYSSSDEEIATVDASGLVTFLKAGKVTITVKQKVLYEGAAVKSDSYQFNVVEGINVWNFDQFNIAVKKLDEEINKDRQENFAAIILQSDVASPKGEGGINISYNLYGNGHMLDFSARSGPAKWSRFVISGKKNLVIDNITLRATSFTDGAQLKKKDTNVAVANCSNILFYNCTIENAETGLWVSSSSVAFEGCIFRNCLKTGLSIDSNVNSGSNVRVKDSIFTSSFCGIWIAMKSEKDLKANNLVLEGQVRFYNWSTLEQLEQGLDLKQILDDAGVSFVADEMVRQVKDLASKNTAYCYTYQGQEYYNFGVMAVNADIPGKNFKAPVNFDRSKLDGNCNYSMFNFSGAINLGLVVPVDFSILSLSNSNPFIKPGDSYLGNTTLLNTIRKPCRF